MFFIEEMHELCLLYSLSFWRCTAKVELLRRAASFRSEASSEAQAKRRACAGHRAIQKCHGQSDGWLYKMPCHSKTKCHSWKKHEHIMNNDIINYHQLSSPLPQIRIGVVSFHDFLHPPGDDFARVGRQ